ncbi:MAG: hypothetical protein JSU98_15740, partial [Gemmatimonadales bacterium]
MRPSWTRRRRQTLRWSCPAQLPGHVLVVMTWAAALTWLVPALAAQQVLPPNRGGFTESMGTPPVWRWHGGTAAALYRGEEDQAAFYAMAGVYRDLLDPTTAALGVVMEGYLGSRGVFTEAANAVDGGLRIGLHSPVTRLGIGWDYNIRDREGDVVLSLVHPLKRGGFLVTGAAGRLDYLPGRRHSFAVSVRIPFGQRFLGRTRSPTDKVQLSAPEPPEILADPPEPLAQAMSQARDHALWLYWMTMPFTDQWDQEYDVAMERFVREMDALRIHAADGDHHAPWVGWRVTGTGGPSEEASEEEADPHGHGPSFGWPKPTAIAEVEAYHHYLDRAFSLATSSRPLGPEEVTPLGVETAAEAREIVMELVLLPYNRLLGQKKEEDSTRGLGASASAEFYEWLTRSEIPRDRLDLTKWVFAELLDVVEDVREYGAREWDDSRFVWLPFQLALKPEQHDSQEELNDLLERATQGTFSRANKHWYIENEQFQAELTRMILQAEDYHVLWIHDFRGYDTEGDPDEMAFKQVVHAYLPALINAVHDYDEVGKVPQYFIFHDQIFYEANRGELFLDLLQNPLHHEIDLPNGFQAWEDSIAGLQAQLAQAVAESELLQAQALHFRDGWIENVVKVHVSITNPPDPTFWTREILPWPIGLPDMVTRDHRKITFYDVTEEDPYKGMAMYTGAGVGEHYVGAGWEDRAMLVQGPMLLALKGAARTLLENQGFQAREIPWELRAKQRADDYDQVVADSLEALGTWGWDMELHNQIGFRHKAVTIAKATLYTLMPPGSVIKAPDSLWGSHFWASLLIGHALRGGRTLVIAPALANAPSAGFPQMSRAQDVLARLVVAEDILGDEIERVGGLLKVGVFDSRISTGDIPAKIRAFGENLQRTPWLRELYGFHPEVLAGLGRQADLLVASGFQRDYTIEQNQSRPKLHLKANYFATREAWDELLARPDVVAAFQTYFEEIARQNQALAEGDYREYSFLLEELLPTTHAILNDYMDGLPDGERERIAAELYAR